MNEKIQNLMRQAGTDTSGKWMSIDNAQKFRELIVMEVIEECSKMCVEHASWTPRMIANQVKQHFGVEL